MGILAGWISSIEPFQLRSGLPQPWRSPFYRDSMSPQLLTECFAWQWHKDTQSARHSKNNWRVAATHNKTLTTQIERIEKLQEQVGPGSGGASC